MHVRLKRIHLIILSFVNCIIPETLSNPSTTITTNTTTAVPSTKPNNDTQLEQHLRQVTAYEMHDNSLVEVRFANQADHVIYKNGAESRNRCKRAENDLDSCSAQLLAFGLEEATFPNDIQQLESQYCPRFKRLVNCIKSSTDCYQPFEKQIIK